MDGAQNVVDLVTELGHPTPTVHKYIDHNIFEENRCDGNPGLRENLRHCQEGEDFKLDKVSLLPIQTPGHMSDHLCFVVKEEG